MKNPAVRLAVGVLIGFLLLAGTIWLLSQSLGYREPLYAGHDIDYWQQQLDGPDAGASNQAYATVNNQIIPEIFDVMLHDTSDSGVKLATIAVLNGIPGIRVNFNPADGRRAKATVALGELGPAAKAAVPGLIKALNGNDAAIRGPAIEALGNVHGDPDVIVPILLDVLKGQDSTLRAPAVEALGRIHSKPDVVIPILIPLLTNEDLNVAAATALGNFGNLARAAIPKIIPLLYQDKESHMAAVAALQKIDPAAAAKSLAR